MSDSRADLIAGGAERVVNEFRETGLDKVDNGAFVPLVVERFAPAEIRPDPKRVGGRHPERHGVLRVLRDAPPQGWERVGKLAEARAGDITAWRDPRSGHVSLIERPPRFDAKARVWTLRAARRSADVGVPWTHPPRRRAGPASGRASLHGRRRGSRWVSAHRRGVAWPASLRRGNRSSPARPPSPRSATEPPQRNYARNRSAIGAAHDRRDLRSLARGSRCSRAVFSAPWARNGHVAELGFRVHQLCCHQ
jgi:hypothetical protein